MHIGKKNISFPFIKQTGMMECGTTSLAMILKHYGLPNIQQYLSDAGNVTTEGTSMYMLSVLAEKFGFKVDCYELDDYKYLQEVKLPLIAHYEGNHFVVIYKVAKESIWIADPAFGKTSMSKTEFLKKWNGVVMIMEPTDELFNDNSLNEEIRQQLNTEKSVFKIFYRPVFKKFRKDLLEIVLGSLILNLLGIVPPFLTLTIVDVVIPNQNKQMLFAILAAFILSYILRIGILYIRNLLMVNFKVKFELEFFSLFFKHFLSLTQKYYDDKKREDFISRFQENLRLREIANPTILQHFYDFIFIIVVLPFLFYIQSSMAWITFFFCILYLLLIVLFTPKILHLAEKITFKNISVLGKFLDALLGIKSVKLMGIEHFMFRKWRNEFQRSLNVVTKNERILALTLSLEGAILFLATLTIYWIGANKVFNHEMTLGEYLAFLSLFAVLLQCIRTLQILWPNYTNLKVSIKRINDILIQDSEIGTHQSNINSTIDKIAIQNLQFKYNTRDSNLVLDNLSLEIKKGEHIGIVGRNGTGKSTLAKLIVNLYPNFRGSISVNNQEIRTINPRDLRRKIYLFPQDIYIFDGTIAENLRYANPEASLENLIDACKNADLFDYIQSTYLGFNQIVGNYGSNLSGGQILKLGFARLFLSTPDVIILDEASSQLDLETERKIMANLYRIFNDKIILSIAHRIHTLKNADRIIVIDDAIISEQGTHDELLQKNGIYYKLVSNYLNY